MHAPYATAPAALLEPTRKPIDQNTVRFLNRLASDADYAGSSTRKRKVGGWPDARAAIVGRRWPTTVSW